jgi:hypothetical protein
VSIQPGAIGKEFEIMRDSKTLHRIVASSGTDQNSCRRERRKLRWFVAFAAALTITVLAIWTKAQSLFDSSTNSSLGNRPQADISTHQHGPGFTLVDPSTWDVISPSGDQQGVASLNTPELRQARAEAAFAIHHPVAPGELPTQSPAELEARAQAAAAILNPATSTIGDWVASQPVEKQEDYLRAIKAILQPPAAP